MTLEIGEKRQRSASLAASYNKDKKGVWRRDVNMEIVREVKEKPDSGDTDDRASLPGDYIAMEDGSDSDIEIGVKSKSGESDPDVSESESKSEKKSKRGGVGVVQVPGKDVFFFFFLLLLLLL